MLFSFRYPAYMARIYHAAITQTDTCDAISPACILASTMRGNDTHILRSSCDLDVARAMWKLFPGCATPESLVYQSEPTLTYGCDSQLAGSCRVPVISDSISDCFLHDSALCSFESSNVIGTVFRSPPICATVCNSSRASVGELFSLRTTGALYRELGIESIHRSTNERLQQHKGFYRRPFCVPQYHINSFFMPQFLYVASQTGAGSHARQRRRSLRQNELLHVRLWL